MTSSRFLDAFRAMVLAVLPDYHLLRVYRYRVAQISGNRLHLQAISKAFGLPDALNVPMRPGLPGGFGKPMLASEVLVQFIEGDASQPFVAHFDAIDAPGFMPTTASLDASDTVKIGANASSVVLGNGFVASPSAGTVVRIGDSITIGTATGAVAAGAPLPTGYSRVKA